MTIEAANLLDIALPSDNSVTLSPLSVKSFEWSKNE
jgi:hypothetical protein